VCIGLNYVVGAMISVSWTVGPLIGGPIVTRLKLNIPRILGAIVIAHSVMTIGYLIAMLLECPEAEWAGTTTQEGLALRSTYELAKPVVGLCF